MTRHPVRPGGARPRARDDDEEPPLYLGVGACQELGGNGKRKRRRRPEPIGFIHFAARKREQPPPPRRTRASRKAARPPRG